MSAVVGSKVTVEGFIADSWVLSCWVSKKSLSKEPVFAEVLESCGTGVVEKKRIFIGTSQKFSIEGSLNSTDSFVLQLLNNVTTFDQIPLRICYPNMFTVFGIFNVLRCSIKSGVKDAVNFTIDLQPQGDLTSWADKFGEDFSDNTRYSDDTGHVIGAW